MLKIARNENKNWFTGSLGFFFVKNKKKWSLSSKLLCMIKNIFMVLVCCFSCWRKNGKRSDPAILKMEWKYANLLSKLRLIVALLSPSSFLAVTLYFPASSTATLEIASTATYKPPSFSTVNCRPTAVYVWVIMSRSLALKEYQNARFDQPCVYYCWKLVSHHGTK